MNLSLQRSYSRKEV